MMRRLFWFLLGALAGVVGVSWATRKVVDFSEQVKLASVVSALVSGVQPAVASPRPPTDLDAMGQRGPDALTTF